MTKCPQCGFQSDGKFCRECGTPLSLSCSSCRAPVGAGAKFCPECGAPTAVSSSARKVQPVWIAIAAAGVGIVLAVIALVRSPNPTGTIPPPVSASPAGVPDLSTMTPREQADRLFNRVMAAHEQGNVEEVNRFQPMAIQAYQVLDSLDNDGRYHLGLIYTIIGDVVRARAQLDSLRQLDPDHLLATLLDHTLSESSGDQAAMASAKRKFMEDYEQEIGTGKQEYTDHRQALDTFRQDVGTPPTSNP